MVSSLDQSGLLEQCFFPPGRTHAADQSFRGWLSLIGGTVNDLVGTTNTPAPKCTRVNDT
ncbi:hypothetical protein APED_25055 [Acanthopleuribacter pedis]